MYVCGLENRAGREMLQQRQLEHFASRLVIAWVAHTVLPLTSLLNMELAYDAAA